MNINVFDRIGPCAYLGDFVREKKTFCCGGKREKIRKFYNCEYYNKEIQRSECMGCVAYSTERKQK